MPSSESKATLEEARTALRKTQGEVKSTIDAAAVVKAELDQVRGTAGHLSQDYARLRDTSKEVREDSVAAAESVKELERKLVPLMQLQELSRDDRREACRPQLHGPSMSHRRPRPSRASDRRWNGPSSKPSD